jgi:DHA3 family macrolide efflux protein-like MFS transporter
MYARLFRNRNFMALWIGQTISFIGDYFVMLAMPVAVNRLTGSAMMVGLSFMATALPGLLLGPVAGVFIDRWDRRKVMIVSDVMRGLLVLLMLLVHSAEQIWIYYLVGFLLACTSQFFLPARNAVLPLIVKDADELLAANGLMQIVQTIGFLVGPALAGYSIGLYGESVAFIANSIGYFASAVAVLVMVVPHTAVQRAASGALQAVITELRAGLVYLFTNTTTLGVMIMLTVSQLGIGAFIVVWVPFLQRYYNLGAEGVGIIDSVFGAGMVLGGMLLGTLSRRIRKTRLAPIAMLLMGLIAAPIGYSPNFFTLLLLNFLFGIALVPLQSTLTTLLQLAVPDEKRGRVGSSLNAMVNAGGLISMAFASFFGELMGLRNLLVLVGVMIVLSGVLGFRLLKEPDPLGQSTNL